MDLFWQIASWNERQFDGSTAPPPGELHPDDPQDAPSAGERALAQATFLIDRITRAVALYCGGTLLFILMAIIMVDVIGRYVLNRPLHGSLDLSITFLVLVVASSIAYGGRTGAHVTADIFTTLVGPLVEWVMALFVKLFAALIVAVWCWRLIVSGQTAARLGETTLLLEIPFRPIYFALAFGVGLYAIALLLEAVMLALKGEAPLMLDESRIARPVSPATGSPQ